MTTNRTQLLARKNDLVEALRALERDRETATIDAGAYHRSRNRYETEAASILEQLDGEPISQPDGALPNETWRSRRLPAMLSLGGVVLAIVLLMVGALRARGAGDSSTGSLPSPVSVAAPISPAVRAAERTVSHHLHNAADWTLLGQAQLNVGDVNDGTTALDQAMRLDPHSGVAPTVLALDLGARGHLTQALSYLTRAEQAQPGYARAWLADGLLASRSHATLSRAITSLRRFLALQPHSAVAPQARAILRSAERVKRP